MDQFDKKLEEMGVRIKDADQFKVSDDVFDDVTLLSLYKLVHKKHLSLIGGSISTGKEANVFYGERDGTSIAIKIYRNTGPVTFPIKHVRFFACAYRSANY